MSVQPTTPDDPTVAQPDPSPDPGDVNPDTGKTFTQDELNKAIADRLKREREKYADVDEARRKAAEYDKLADAQKSEQQRQAEQAARLQADLEAQRAENLRLRIANTHGISGDDLDMLGAGDEETLTRRAERLASLRREAAEAEALRAQLAASGERGAPGVKTPAVNLRPGASPAAVVAEADDAYPAHWIPKQ